MVSFVAMVWEAGDPRAAETAVRLGREIQALPSAPRIFESSGFLLANLSAGPVRAHILPLATGGAVFGTLFKRSVSLEPASCLLALSPQDSICVHASSGRALLAGFWGSYIAFVRCGRGHQVIADPASSIPCFHFRQGPVTVLFSHLERCPPSFWKGLTLNRGFVLKLLAYDKIQNGETGLNEIRELEAGYSLSVTPDKTEQRLAWDPRAFARSREHGSQADAASALRQVASYVVRSWAECYPAIALNLSGGLDSAIVAACLTNCGGRANVHGIHFVLKGGDPSEAAYARAAASALGIELEEMAIDPQAALPPPDAYPPAVRPYREFLGQRLPERDAGGLQQCPTFTGQGGDHLFLETRTPLILADYLMSRGPGPRMVRELVNAARLSGYSVWRVLKEVLEAMFTGTQAGPLQLPGITSRRTQVNQLAHDGLDGAGLLPAWARRPDGVTPAKFAQVVSLVHLFQVRSGLASSGAGALVHPLISQPLIEFCLETPAYVLCADGWPRGLARQAMAGLVPDAVRLRRSKGDASRFYIEQLGANHALLAGTLLDGELVAGGYIDRRDAEAFLEPGAFRTQTFGRMILVYYVIECWLRRWKYELRQARTRSGRPN